jgi:aryl-alcohol dehydrogenase-like predicted oxidoreductase
MEYRRLGRTGMEVSALCLGTMQFGWTADEATSLRVLDAAWEAGINFIDTADIYSRWAPGNSGGESERILGVWLGRGRVPRQRLVIATKVRGEMGDGPNASGLTRKHILASAEGSLRRMGCGTIDLYQCHWPDEATPIEETLEAFEVLLRRGDVLAIGCSNFPAWRLMQALWTSDRRGLTPFTCVQPHYSLLQRAEFERELEAVCLEYGLGVIPYSPLAGGFLTGKYRRGEAPAPGTRGASSSRLPRYMADERAWALLDLLQEQGAARGQTPSQMALAWLLSRPSVTSPIIGPRSLEQLNDNLGAVGLRLDAAEVEALDRSTAWADR